MIPLHAQFCIMHQHMDNDMEFTSGRSAGHNHADVPVCLSHRTPAGYFFLPLAGLVFTSKVNGWFHDVTNVVAGIAIAIFLQYIFPQTREHRTLTSCACACRRSGPLLQGENRQ